MVVKFKLSKMRLSIKRVVSFKIYYFDFIYVATLFYVLTRLSFFCT
jgi:hypothetical protein